MLGGYRNRDHYTTGGSGLVSDKVPTERQTHISTDRRTTRTHKYYSSKKTIILRANNNNSSSDVSMGKVVLKSLKSILAKADKID